MKITGYTLLITFAALAACKKSGKTNTPPVLFHKDVTIHESIRGSEQMQNTLGLYQLPGQQQLLFVASRGTDISSARGFRIGSLTKDSGVNWIRSYDLPETVYYQYATCATMDKNQFTWVGGHIFGVPDSYGRPFLVKLNSKGETVWSKYFVSTVTPLNTARGTAVYTLQNGDIAYLTMNSQGIIMYRLSADGNILWAKSILQGNLVFDNPSSNTNTQIITEAPDGNIYLALTSNNPVNGKDCLVKLSSSGDLVFAKSFLFQPYYISYQQPQIICKENGDLIYANEKWASISYRPYIYLISGNGSLLNGKGFPFDRTVSNPFFINELQYNSGNIYLSTTAGYQFSLYKIDASLNVVSSEKTLGTTGIATDPGGRSVYDNTTQNWYHLLDITGLSADGNGFQFLKTDGAGQSCHDYTNPPEELVMQVVTPTINDETSITVQNISFPTLTNLSWQSTTVITKLETACSK